MKDLTRKEVLLLGLYAAFALVGLRWLGRTFFGPDPGPSPPTVALLPAAEPVVPSESPKEGVVREDSSELPRAVADQRGPGSVVLPGEARPDDAPASAPPRTRILRGRVVGQGSGGRVVPLLFEPLDLVKNPDPHPKLAAAVGPRFTYSEEDGSFTVRNLAAGSWVVRVTSGDESLPSPISESLASRAQRFEVDPGCSHPLQVQLLPTHAVRTTTSAPDGLPMTYALLDELGYVLRRGVLDRRRPPTFELVPGDYLLRMGESPGSSTELPFSVRPNDPKQRELPLESALR